MKLEHITEMGKRLSPADEIYNKLNRKYLGIREDNFDATDALEDELSIEVEKLGFDPTSPEAHAIQQEVYDRILSQNDPNFRRR